MTLPGGLTPQAVRSLTERMGLRAIVRAANDEKPFPEPLLDIPTRPRKPQIVIPPDVIPFGDWMRGEMQRTGDKYQAIFMRLKRGKYPQIERLYVGTVERANYVRVKTI